MRVQNKDHTQGVKGENKDHAPCMSGGRNKDHAPGVHDFSDHQIEA